MHPGTRGRTTAGEADRLNASRRLCLAHGEIDVCSDETEGEAEHEQGLSPRHPPWTASCTPRARALLAVFQTVDRWWAQIVLDSNRDSWAAPLMTSRRDNSLAGGRWLCVPRVVLAAYPAPPPASHDYYLLLTTRARRPPRPLAPLASLLAFATAVVIAHCPAPGTRLITTHRSHAPGSPSRTFTPNTRPVLHPLHGRGPPYPSALTPQPSCKHLEDTRKKTG